MKHDMMVFKIKILISTIVWFAIGFLIIFLKKYATIDYLERFDYHSFIFAVFTIYNVILEFIIHLPIIKHMKKNRPDIHEEAYGWFYANVYRNLIFCITHSQGDEEKEEYKKCYRWSFVSFSLVMPFTVYLFFMKI